MTTKINNLNELFEALSSLPMGLWIAFGVWLLLIIYMVSPLSGWVIDKLIKSDLEDMKKGRIWSPLGYKDISSIPLKERIKKYGETIHKNI